MNGKINSFFRTLSAVVTVLFCFHPQLFAADTEKPNIKNMLTMPDALPFDFDLTKLENLKEMTPAQASTGFIDNAIDPDNYFIGMGDAFVIAILEKPSATMKSTVNQNGELYLHGFGDVKIADLSLRQAKEAITDFLNRKLKSKSTILIALEAGKKVRVTVNGAFTLPGTNFVDGVLRISDCIIKANKGIVPTITDFDLRNVEVRKPDTVIYLDMFRYFLKNDLSQNPYVRPGDVIFVGGALHRVFVLGEIKFPPVGFVPIRPKERLRDFLDLLILSDAADSSMIIIQKGSSALNRHDTIVSSSSDIVLNDMDIVTIAAKPNYPRITTVYISGAVVRQGPYSCIESVTKAEDILSLCGGSTPQANLKRAYILRRNTKPQLPQEEQDDDKTSIPQPQEPFSIGSIRTELNFGFARLNNLQDYTVISLGEEGFDVLLENGDHIVIPFIERFVYVSGSVSNPGAYQFKEGEGKRYYIKQAGGYIGKSDRSNTYILTRHLNVFKIKDGKTIDEGDIVVVPDATNDKVLSKIILPLIQIFSTAATLLVAVVSLASLNK